MKYPALIGLGLCTLSSFGQDTVYYDSYFREVSAETTDQYRVHYQDSSFKVAEDYQENKLVLSAKIEGDWDQDAINAFLWYVKNSLSEMDKKPYFRQFKADISFYQPPGSVLQTHYNGDKMRYYQLLDSLGEPVLWQGNGRYAYNSAELGGTHHMVFSDSTLVDEYVVRAAEKDTIYNQVDQMASPKGGFAYFYHQLIKTLRYPLGKHIAGKEGQVFIRFVVAEDGRMTEFEPLNQPNGFERKTLRRLAKLPDWQPATLRGNPVKTQFVLPIIFKLE